MFFVEVSGTPYEMGYQFGRATKLAIASTLDFLAKGFRHWDDARLERARQRHMSYTEKRVPELVEEIQGIADGAGVAFRWIYLANCYASLRAAREQCSNVVFTDTPDGPLLAKTNDLPVSEGKHTGVCLRRAQGGPAILSATFPGTIWRGAGINDAGLAVGGSSCWAQIAPPAEFFNPHLLSGYVLQRCATVEHAIALLREVVCSNRGVNLALLDKTGAAAVVEKAGNLMGVRRPLDGWLWCTNHALTPELAPYRTGSSEAVRESQDRYEAIDRMTRGQGPGLEMLRRILSYTARPGALSRYGDDDPVRYETEMACIMQPAAGRVEFCFSHPDRDPWHPFSFQSGWQG